MISRMFFLDFIKNKKNLLLKFFIPFIIVTVAFQFGFGKITLVMLLIFTVITGSGLKIIKLKTSGVYNRLIISPLGKSNLFLEIATITSLFYFIQFIPALFVAAFFGDILIIPYSIIAIIIIVFIGILIGIHAKSFGDIHLYSILAFIPLIGFVMVKSNFSLIFPFISIVDSEYTIFTLITPCITILFLCFILIFDVKRL